MRFLHRHGRLIGGSGLLFPAAFMLLEAIRSDRANGEHADVVFGLGLGASVVSACIWALVLPAMPRAMPRSRKVATFAGGTWFALAIGVLGLAGFRNLWLAIGCYLLATAGVLAWAHAFPA